MKLYTSRFANHALADADIAVVAISRGLPKFRIAYEIRGRIWPLAPERALFGLGEEDYHRLYRNQLDSIGATVIQRELARFEQFSNVALCCFEDVRKQGQWCHRRLFAAWWEEHTGQAIEEYPEPFQQTSLWQT